ncbi:hypothetical protein B0H10DRAFT_2076583, partial [Mycena sp. CBHHK59/15]
MTAIRGNVRWLAFLPRPRTSVYCLGVSFHRLCKSCFCRIDFDQCFSEIRNGLHGHIGGTDNQGNPVNDTVNATSITYDLCIQACGSGAAPSPGPRSWDNLMSVVLALGSPCLAAYSLTLTVLNNKWVARRFARSQYPNNRHAALILSITTDGNLLASLVLLPENDEWWIVLAEWLDYADIHTWTIAGVTSVAWVIVAYALTIIDAFSTISTNPNSNGQGLSGVGWLWMLPLMRLGRLTTALNRANSIAYVAGPNGVSGREIDARPLYRDQEATAPIYNYSRFSRLPRWWKNLLAFRLAAEKAHRYKPVNGNVQWHVANRNHVVHPRTERGRPSRLK